MITDDPQPFGGAFRGKQPHEHARLPTPLLVTKTDHALKRCPIKGGLINPEGLTWGSLTGTGDGAVHKLFSAPVGRQVAAAVSVVKVYGRGPWRTRSAKCFAVGWSAGRCSDSNSCALRIGQRERPNERDSAVDDVLAAVTLQGDGW